MTNTSKLVKYGGIAAIVLILGLIAFYIYQTNYRSDKVQVTVSTLPSDATVTINGNKVGNGDTYVMPGTYTVVIAKSGFTTQTNTVTFTKPTGIIDIGLNAESDAAKAWVAQHTNDYLALEGRAGARADEAGQQAATINPIISHLPYENLLFTIGYFVDPTDSTGKSIVVTIDAPEGYRQAAINKIVEWGFKPAELNITFTGYTNPFVS